MRVFYKAKIVGRAQFLSLFLFPLSLSSVPATPQVFCAFKEKWGENKEVRERDRKKEKIGVGRKKTFLELRPRFGPGQFISAWHAKGQKKTLFSSILIFGAIC